MPCMSYDYPDPTPTVKRDDRKLEPLLCSACRVLDRLGYDFDENPALSEWWAEHKRKDDARIAREKAQAAREAQDRARCDELLSVPFKELAAEDIKLLKKYGYMP